MKVGVMRIVPQTNTADARTEYLVCRGGITLAWFLREDHAKLFVEATWRKAFEESGWTGTREDIEKAAEEMEW